MECWGLALLSIIRRWHFRDHLLIRGIAKHTGLSRNTTRPGDRAMTRRGL
jgi:DNA-binding IclR family transcriptional regulator